MSQILKAVERKKTQNPQMEYMWRVELPSLVQPANSPYPRIGACEQRSGTELDDLSSRITSIEAPNPTLETKKNTLNSSFFYTATHNDIGNITIKIDEMEDGLTLDYFNCWMSSIVDSNGLYYPPAAYKRDIKIVRLSSTGDDIHFSRYIGYFPTGISPINYSYESAGIMQYSVSFTGDTVEHYIIPAHQIRQAVDNAQRDFIGRGKPGFGKGNLGGGLNNEIADIVSKMGNAVKSLF
jgi:hypothetical protein